MFLYISCQDHDAQKIVLLGFLTLQVHKTSLFTVFYHDLSLKIPPPTGCRSRFFGDQLRCVFTGPLQGFLNALVYGSTPAVRDAITGGADLGEKSPENMAEPFGMVMLNQIVCSTYTLVN